MQIYQCLTVPYDVMVSDEEMNTLVQRRTVFFGIHEYIRYLVALLFFVFTEKACTYHD